LRLSFHSHYTQKHLFRGSVGLKFTDCFTTDLTHPTAPVHGLVPVFYVSILPIVSHAVQWHRRHDLAMRDALRHHVHYMRNTAFGCLVQGPETGGQDSQSMGRCQALHCGRSGYTNRKQIDCHLQDRQVLPVLWARFAQLPCL